MMTSGPLSAHEVYRRHKASQLRRLRGQHVHVDAATVSEHLRALTSHGMAYSSIGQAAGCSGYFVSQIVSGKYATLRRDLAHALLHTDYHPLPCQTMVLSVGLTRRAHALATVGWPLSLVADALDMQPCNVARLCARAGLVHYWRWHIVSELYDELSMREGPCGQSRVFAYRQGWPSPLAWDDDEIDDPTASAHVRPHATDDQTVIDSTAIERAMSGELGWRSLTRSERAVVVTRLWAHHYTDPEIAVRVHASPRSILRARRSLGLAPNAPQLPRGA